MAPATLALTAGIFEIEQHGDTLIVVPVTNLRELDHQRVEAGERYIFDLLNDAAVKNVILDFYRTDYFGSTALGLFVNVWKTVRHRGGRMAFCNVSNHEQEILRITNLDHFWPICSSRGEAVKAVHE